MEEQETIWSHVGGGGGYISDVGIDICVDKENIYKL